ncbi:arylsulfatase [Pedobacter frigoris]|uniref:Arylsulfatase n=1 Tax=Pedobacter frigoris TaxID=2571272 RepID=A0A4U1CQ04_9SPHI|nr:arylsulfatase [Pedobacter frigoris]TKC08960.1 arylsulfatase [Pedobacter frigoris]
MNKLVLLALILFINGNVFAQSEVSAKKPNIIYIYADDMGYGETGPYGQKLIKTPNLDKMAREGMKFTQHYTSTPVCAPARCMLMTGKHGGHSYIRGNYEMGGFSDDKEGGQMPLPEGIFTIPAMLKSVGYTTGMSGKWGLGMHNSTGSPNKQGFDYAYGLLDQKQAHNFYPTHLWENGKWDTLSNHYFDSHKRLDSARATDEDFASFIGKDYAATKMTEKALKFIENNKKKPFFLYLPYTIPHVGLQVPSEELTQYIGKFPGEKPYYGQNGYNPSKYPLSTYAAMITYLDKQIGLVMEKVKALGLDDNTIIMFSSDNGATFNGGVQAKYFNSVAGLRGLKMDLFEGGIREPFIARWPGKIPANTSSDLISAQFDMMATFAAISGAKTNNTDGISLLPTLLGKPNMQRQREYLYFEYPEKGGQVAIRMGDWKGVRINVRKDINAPWMIFNLKTDMGETTDLAAQHPELIAKFNAIMKKEHQISHINEWEFLESKMPKKGAGADAN